MITNAPWNVSNRCLRNDLGIPYVMDDTKNDSSRYLELFSDRINFLAISLLDKADETLRLEGFQALVIPNRLRNKQL